MKKFAVFVSLVFLVLIASSTCFADAKADGYSFVQDESFKPGDYVAIRDAKAYTDADVSAPWPKGNVKKGKRLHVFSAGYNAFNKKGLWLNTEEDGFTGYQAKDFKRIDAP